MISVMKSKAQLGKGGLEGTMKGLNEQNRAQWTIHAV